MSKTDNPDNNLSLPHRDDVPMELAEMIQASFAESHPGCKVVFAGDMPSELPLDVLEYLKAMAEVRGQSIVRGHCIDCGKQMDNWPPPDDENVPWEMATGWRIFRDIVTGDPCMFQCPECDVAEEAEAKRDRTGE